MAVCKRCALKGGGGREGKKKRKKRKKEKKWGSFFYKSVRMFYHRRSGHFSNI